MKKQTGENPLDHLFQDPNLRQSETQSSANGLLARWWRTIVADLHITAISLSERMQHYLEISHPSENRIAASNARGSFNKKLAGSEFTWKVFLEGLKTIGTWKIDFQIKLYNIDGNESVHTLSALLMNDEQVKAFRERWSKEHGIHEVDSNYIENLRKQREEIIKAKALRIKGQEDNVGGVSFFDQVLKDGKSKK